MKKVQLAGAALLITALLAGRSWAPIFSFFPGLNKLTERTEQIVVVTVLPQPNTPQIDFGGGSTEKIRIVAVLKGDLKPGVVTTAYVRRLPFSNGRIGRQALLANGYVPGEHYVLFLVKNKTSKYEFEYRNENSSGDSFWVSPNSDLSKIKANDVRGNITFLLHDVIEYQKSHLKDLQETVDAYLEENESK